MSQGRREGVYLRLFGKKIPIKITWLTMEGFFHYALCYASQDQNGPRSKRTEIRTALFEQTRQDKSRSAIKGSRRQITTATMIAEWETA